MLLFNTTAWDAVKVHHNTGTEKRDSSQQINKLPTGKPSSGYVLKTDFLLILSE